MEFVILGAVFLGVMAFAYVGIQLFSQGWESYEEKYDEIEVSMESLLLTIPSQHILYLSMLSGLVGYIGAYFMFGNLMGGVIIGGFFLLFPRVSLVIYKKKRQKKFANQLIDALGALSNSLRAGHALPKAIEILSTESPDPLKQEMKIVVQEMRLGDTLVESLRNLEKRMPNEDLDLLATAISIAGEVGGNLTEVFDNIADTIRERNKIEGRIEALTSQGKAQGFVVAMLPLILGLAVNAIDPKMFEPMYTTWYGWSMIGLVILLEVVALLIIRKIVTIRV